MSRAKSRVRCYNCGRPGARDAPSCGRCRANFRALCPCGADICIYEDECPACGAPHVPKRMPLSMHPLVRASKWSVAAAAVAIAANALFSARPAPAWKLKAQAHQSYEAGDFETAAKKYQSVTEQSPGDAEGWFMHALCLSRLGMSPEAFLPDAQKAALIAPGKFAVRGFLARYELEAGHVDRALEHAEAAARAPEADGRAFQLVAEIELRRPQPNLQHALDALEKARTAGIDTPELRVLLAEVSLRLYGVTAAETGRLPQHVNVALREAVSALDDYAARDRDSTAVGVAKARVLLALGRADDAFAAADGALRRLAPDATPASVAEIRLLRGMALHARGSRAEAMADLAAALHEAPEARIAAAANAYLIAADDEESAHALLVAAAASNDPTGGIRAVLAATLLSRGKLDEAAAAIVAARSLSSSNSSYAEIEGAIRAAQGRVAEARDAYADAVRLAPNLVGPRIGAALSQLAGGAPDAEALRRVTAEIESLRARFGDDPRLLAALGHVRLAAGDADGAMEALEKAKDAAPADSFVWRTLAVARRKSDAPDALRLAADAYARARALEPNDVSLVVAEAETRLAAGDASAAVAACTDRLRTHPDEPSVLALRAQAYRRLGMWPSAVVDLRRLRATRKDDDGTLAEFVDTLFRAGDADGARRVIAEAEPGATQATVRVLEVLSALHGGDVSAALDKLKLSGPSTLLAEVQLAAGRVDDAIVVLRELNKARPTDAWVARLLVIALLDVEPPTPERIAEAKAVAALLPADAPRGLRNLLSGRLLLVEGDFPGAAEKLKIASQESPADAFAAAYLGEALFRTGEREESLAAFRRAAATPNAPPRMREIAAARLLQASLETKDDARAETLARESTRLAPGNADAAARLAEMLQARGADLEAAQVAERALLIPDVSPVRALSLRLFAAYARIAAGNFAAAQALLDGLDPTESASPAAGLLRGFAKIGGGRFDDADRDFVAVLASDPSQPAAQIGRIETALAAGRKDAASARYAEWRTAHPADRRFFVRATSAFVRRGYVDVAVAMARQALDAAPDDLDLGAEYARTLAAAGRPREGVAAFRDVVARQPEARRTDAELRLGEFMLATPQTASEAVDLARRVAAATAPGGREGVEARVLEAEALLGALRYSEAEAAARIVAKRWSGVETPPEERGFEARLRFVLGSAAGVAGRTAEAVEQLDRCLALAPSDDGASNNLADLLGRNAATAKSGAELAKRVTTRTPGNPSYWDTRGTCSAAAGDEDDAVRAWRRALDLFAASPESDQNLRARTALRFVRFLASKNHADAARAAAESALEFAVGTPVEPDLRSFLTR